MNKYLRYAVIGASIALVIRRFIEPARVTGNSMFPELHDGDRLMIDKSVFDHEDPKAGEVVVFQEPGKDRYLIKRIIGVPGDHVVIHGGVVKVNDVVCNDDYTAEGVTSGEIDMEVPEGRYFCMGDNRLHSRDSRDAMIGCVPKSAMIGKVNVRLYPPGRVYERRIVPGEQDLSEELDLV